MKKFVIDFSKIPDEYDPLTNPMDVKISGSEVEMTSEEIAAREKEEAADGTDAERAMRALREMRKTHNNPRTVVWPDKPE